MNPKKTSRNFLLPPFFFFITRNLIYFCSLKIAAEARTRVKLNLQPRSKPIDPVVVKDDEVNEKPASQGDTPAAAPASAPAPTPVPAANIFGAAKPVDTTAREREIEERLAKKQLKAEEGYVFFFFSIFQNHFIRTRNPNFGAGFLTENQ